MKKIRIWHLKKGEDRRFRQGHPWAYSNEILETIEGVELGEPIELRDPSGEFLARGVANPQSLIRFRTLSRDVSEQDFCLLSGIQRRLKSALQRREALGLTQFSFRWIFGEADHLPGLIIDSYFLENDERVVVIQAQTAGLDRLLPEVIKSVQELSPKETSILIKNDSSARKMEGLEVEKSRWIQNEKLGAQTVRVQSAESKCVLLDVNLFEGQKTGLFLDQTHNISLLKEILVRSQRTQLKVLDLCCYVGHWSTQLAATDRISEIDLVDASQLALDFALKNVKRAGPKVKVQSLKLDVFEKLSTLKESSYDVVIADPPALAKSRKLLSVAQSGYVKLNTEAIKLLKPGGILVSCSCSRLITREMFLEGLAKASRRAEIALRIFMEGSASGDHPLLPEFTEGHYLKSFFGQKEI